ncbi:MAG: zf-HC2 domain-containing protein [Chloroflexota bacterium]|nr:zf-HC2 domain-containing protein [Chloroflexota bacterium]
MVDPDELTCRELVELVTDYLEGTLPAADRQRFEAHLLNCDECPIYVDQMRLTIRAVGALTEEHIPPVARDELLRRFGDWKRNRS